MGLFTRTKTSDPPPESPAGKKIKLNFGSRTSTAVQQIAKTTLASGGFEHVRDGLPPVGAKMPDGTVYAGISPDTSKPMYVTPADASLTMTFNEAQKYAKDLDAHGHQDWRLPTKAELNVLFNNRAAIGGFKVSDSGPAGWYWSGAQNGKWGAWDQRFSGGYQGDGVKVTHSSVRCVR